MAFGMQVQTGNFLPICKYDARAGKFMVVNKRMDGGSDTIEVPPGTKFALDIGTLEAGYVMFTDKGPVRRMVPYTDGVRLPDQPDEKDAEGKLMYRPGFWVKVAGQALEGVREWCSNAAVLVNALDEFYQQIIHTSEAAQGQIPLISIPSTTAVKSGSGARSSTNYGPVFRLEGWVDRPGDLGPRTVPLSPAPNGHGPVVTPQPRPQPAVVQPVVQPAPVAPLTTPAAGGAMPF